MHGGQDRGDDDLRQTEPTNYTIYVTILLAKCLGTQLGLHICSLQNLKNIYTYILKIYVHVGARVGLVLGRRNV